MRLAKAIIVAAPHSGSGKTLVTLGLIRALRNAGYKVASAKVGPDYIDPQFHAAASGKSCVNLDLWAMGKTMCEELLARQAENAEIVIVEGVMGLFDGPQGAAGSTADLAMVLGLPVLLVVDCGHQAQSVAALVYGFKHFQPEVDVAGVFLNRVKSDRHAAMLKESLVDSKMPVIGELRQTDSLHLPSRHLGLVQAQEIQVLEKTLECVAAGVARETKLDNLFQITTNLSNQPTASAFQVPPLGQSIAIASDQAFSFAYPHMLESWTRAGASLSFFSPLADEKPEAHADAVFLPGGYPELHAGKLASNHTFLNGLRQHRGLIYGECGGYMVLGDGLIDAGGKRHAMAGLLPLETSFATRKLHLGYRQLETLGGPFPNKLRGHEFHYASIVLENGSDRLFKAFNAAGEALPEMGLRAGKIMGSFAHIISARP
jgi:cobyrinic acid a,c-diamide synthase